MTFYQDRFKGLDTKSVQRRGTVQQNRMLSDYFFKDIPYFRAYAFNLALSTLNVVGKTFINQLFHNKRLEKFESHFLRKTALVHLQIWSYNDNGTSGVVNTFTEQVLAETSLFTFQHMAERFERTVTRTCYRTAAAAVVDQSIDSFLKHTFFVLHDDVRSTQIQQSLKTVITVDYTAVQVIKVRRSKTAAIQLNHRTKLRRNYREYIHDHPVRFVAGVTEGFNNFKAFDCPVTALALSRAQFFLEEFQFLLDIDILEQFFDCFSTHTCLESVAVFFTIAAVFFFGQELLLLQRCFAWICYNIGCEIDDLFKRSWGHIQSKTHTAWNAFEIPDMRYRSCQLDMAHTFAAHFSAGNFHAAAVADNALITDAFVFTTVTFPVLLRSKNTLAEQAFFFRF
ncbi:hypothetical protein D3C75_685560 [compost metagenome]